MPEKGTNMVEKLLSELKDYLNTRMELLKLKAIHKASNLLTAFATAVFIATIALMVIITLSVGLSLFIGKLLGAVYYGFFIVGGAYLVTGLILFAFRKQLIRIPLGNWLIRNLMD